MYFHNVVGTGSDTTSTTNMYHKDRFHVPGVAIWPSPIRKAFHPILPIVQQHPVHDVSRGAIVARPTGVATAIAFHSACAVARAFIGATFHRATFPDPPGPAIAVARG